MNKAYWARALRVTVTLLAIIGVIVLACNFGAIGAPFAIVGFAFFVHSIVDRGDMFEEVFFGTLGIVLMVVGWALQGALDMQGAMP